jgi:DNA-binding CsgD family transcriptional regulator
MPGAKPMQRLSWGEVEALCWAANGYTTKEIAVELGVSFDAVKTRLHRAMRKLGATSTTQAVALALVTGQLDRSGIRVTPAARRSAREALRVNAPKR